MSVSFFLQHRDQILNRQFFFTDPCSVINYVARSRVMVVNDFVDGSDNAISDPYLKTHRPKSILCLALSSQQRVVGVLYMEHSRMKNAFVRLPAFFLRLNPLTSSSHRPPIASKSSLSSRDKLLQLSKRLDWYKTSSCQMLTSSDLKPNSKATTTD